MKVSSSEGEKLSFWVLCEVGSGKKLLLFVKGPPRRHKENVAGGHLQAVNAQELFAAFISFIAASCEPGPCCFLCSTWRSCSWEVVSVGASGVRLPAVPKQPSVEQCPIGHNACLVGCEGT